MNGVFVASKLDILTCTVDESQHPTLLGESILNFLLGKIVTGQCSQLEQPR